MQRVALHTAIAIGDVDAIAAAIDPLRAGKAQVELLKDLTRHCCTGAAQMIGGDLPMEVEETWPAFAALFKRARRFKLWPADV